MLSKLWLVAASLFFYGWWNVSYVPLILASAGFNFLIGCKVTSGGRQKAKKLLFLLGIAGNFATLGFFKYFDFLATNTLLFFGQFHEPWDIALPLAISFFTFQQIAYLVDCYQGKAKEYTLANYMVFVSFFPQLIAGPIVHHKEMMPQFESKENWRPSDVAIALGLLLFAIGLFKKVVLADSYALWATHGFDEVDVLSFSQAWATSLSYTFQLYFDFSGYTDMAIGSALLMNIRLPFNFNSPYKALSIKAFWQSWHMTLSRFLRDYVYIPLGGNRRGDIRVSANLFLTFLLGGLWHGAAWTFVLWGALHGAALIIFRLWQRFGAALPKMMAWGLTFLFVMVSWVLFRAESWGSAQKIFQGMIDIGHISMVNYAWFAALAVGFVIVLALPNSNRLQDKNIKTLPHRLIAFFAGVLMCVSILVFEVRKTSEFLYFQF